MIPGRVRSTNILQLEYDQVAKKLRVTFQSGKRYEYKNVSMHVYIYILSSESIGSAFNAVKDMFEFEQIDSIKVY